MSGEFTRKRLVIRNLSALVALLTGSAAAGSVLASPFMLGGQEPDRYSWVRGPLMGAVLEAESVDDVPLSRVGGMALDSEGRVYVQDDNTLGVIVLAEDLTYLHTLGRSGRGPGEFRGISTVRVGQGDSVSVYDRSLNRITVYARGSAEPAYVRRVSSGPYQDVHWVSEGFVAIRAAAYEASGSDIGTSTSWLVRLLDDGSIAGDSLFSFPRKENLVHRTGGPNGATVSISRHPFGHQPFVQVVDADSLRAVYVSSLALAVTVVNMEAGTKTTFAHPTEPLDVTSRELAAELSRKTDRFARILRDGAPYTWPPIVGMVAGDGGLVLLGLRSSNREVWEWAMFGADGAHLASIALPAGFVTHAVRDGRFVGSIVDDNDVPVIRSYRMATDTLRTSSPG